MISCNINFWQGSCSEDQLSSLMANNSTSDDDNRINYPEPPMERPMPNVIDNLHGYDIYDDSDPSGYFSYHYNSLIINYMYKKRLGRKTCWAFLKSLLSWWYNFWIMSMRCKWTSFRLFLPVEGLMGQALYNWTKICCFPASSVMTFSPRMFWLCIRYMYLLIQCAGVVDMYLYILFHSYFQIHNMP